MYAFDVNVFVNAFRSELPHHALCFKLIQDSVDGPHRFAVSELVLSGFVRIVTSRKIFNIPSTSDEALAFCERVLSDPNAQVIRPQSQHWGIFDALCREMSARDKLVSDVYHAALAIEHGVTWVSLDQDFAKFPKKLKWQNPLA